MNPKVIKLKEERRKNCDKIASLQARNKKIHEDIISIENTDIIGMVRAKGLTMEEFAAFLHQIQSAPKPNDKEDTENDE